jgi:nicotinamidase-related amidase
MAKGKMLKLTLRSQELKKDKHGRSVWVSKTKKVSLPAAKTAILLCDVWDTHTQVGAAERLDAMVPRMNRVVRTLRAKGVQIIHSPSDVIARYEGSPARRRIVDCPKVKPPKDIKREDQPLPFSRESTCTDTPTIDTWKGPGYPWTREHPGIEIKDEDVISANGPEVYSFMKHKRIKHLLIMGVHTNCCILHRTFGIKQMVKWGVDIALVRDLTDSIYGPAKPPYVSHEEGTGLVVGYIEKFWCPTITSDQLLR